MRARLGSSENYGEICARIIRQNFSQLSIRYKKIAERTRKKIETKEHLQQPISRIAQFIIAVTFRNRSFVVSRVFSLLSQFVTCHCDTVFLPSRHQRRETRHFATSDRERGRVAIPPTLPCEHRTTVPRLSENLFEANRTKSAESNRTY